MREEIIVPLLNALRLREDGCTIHRSKKLFDPFFRVGSKDRLINIFPDYTIERDSKCTFVLDAKAPSGEVEAGNNVAQVFYYAIHQEIKTDYFGLCNGYYLTIFNIKRELLEKVNLRKLNDNSLKNIRKYILADIKQEDFFKKQQKTERDYTLNELPSEYIPVRKRAAKRHFGVHGYFTKQSWNVVQEYIEKLSEQDDVILDPFGGSGVTAIEAMMLDRKGIHIDLNPLSEFIVTGLTCPADINKVGDELNNIIKKFTDFWAAATEKEKKSLKNFYPTDDPLPQGSDVPSVLGLFSEEQLDELALLKKLILEIKNKDVKQSLLLAFSSTINKINLTYHHSSYATRNAGNSAVMAYYRYRIAKTPTKLDTLDTFEAKVKKIIKAKLNIKDKINKSTINRLTIAKGDATNLKKIANESIDYIYTDPPYGKKIPYLDLSTMWTSWLDLAVTEKDFKNEAIEGGSREKSKNEYGDLIIKSIKEMYRVLKWNRWMSIVFQHQDPYFWHLIVDNAEKIGFEYAGVLKQDNGQTSFKKRQNPYTVLSGQMIINFKKVRNPINRLKSNLGDDYFDLVFNHIEAIIAKKQGATLEEINSDIMLYGLEYGYLDKLSKEYSTLTPIMIENFDYDEITKKYHIRKNTKFKSIIPVERRVGYFITSYLRRCERERKYPTFEDIVRHIIPLLRNGTTPEEQTIRKVLKEIAYQYGASQWRIDDRQKKLAVELI